MDSLTEIAPTQLRAIRLQAHWAAQLPCAVGHSLVPAEADFSHTALSWDTNGGRMLSPAVPNGQRLAFDLRQCAITLVGGQPNEQLALHGKSLDEAMAAVGGWLTTELERPGHDLPETPVAQGQPFDFSHLAAARQLSTWFDAAGSALGSTLKTLGQALPVRLWPHHFDLAALWTLQAHEDAEQARSVNLGFSPGDGSYDEPYFYVSPWPYPGADALPALSWGSWHTEGFTAAVLTGSELAGSGSDPADFLLEAARACRTLALAG